MVGLQQIHETEWTSGNKRKESMSGRTITIRQAGWHRRSNNHLLSQQIYYLGQEVFVTVPKKQSQYEYGGKKMSEKKIPYKIYLEESEMPKQWYNVRAGF